MGKKLEAMLGLSTFGLAAVSGVVYGIAHAKGLEFSRTNLYLLPFLSATGFCFGARTTHPDQKIDAKVGGVYAGATAAVGAISFGVGYLAERLLR